MYGLSARIIRRRDEQAEREFNKLTSRINWILSIPELDDRSFCSKKMTICKPLSDRSRTSSFLRPAN